MLTASSTLAIFIMFAISSFALFWAKYLRVPHTVLLVFIGIILGIFANTDMFSFFAEFQLTPNLLFYLLLPTLIFESAYNINFRRILEDIIPISLLAVVSLLVSTGIIGYALYIFLPFLGIQAPLIVTLLFGALISATDPIAVLALFKDFGAPRRLSLIFEGESLFNDATSVAIFLILLKIISDGYTGSETVIAGLTTFTSMMFLGVVFGLFMGYLFSHLVGYVRSNELASITMTIALAHVTFILSELITNTFETTQLPIAISPIIATTVASIVMGNYGRAKIHPRALEFVDHLWEQLAFLANSLIFILIGLLFTQVSFFNKDTLIVVIVTVCIVALARALSIYPILGLYNFFTRTSKIPLSWLHLLSWGSLRGALAITMVLLIPDDAMVSGWVSTMSIKEFMLAVTVGCIFVTLFIKATTISRLMNILGLHTLTPIESIEYQEAKALIHHDVSDKLTKYTQRGYITAESAESINLAHSKAYDEACTNIATLSDRSKSNLAHCVLRIYAIGIETKYLNELYRHNEVNEAVYRRLNAKLQLQQDAIERGNLSPERALQNKKKNLISQLMLSIQKRHTKSQQLSIKNAYMYYRAQTIISRKVLKELDALSTSCAQNVFTPKALAHTVNTYTHFKENSKKKMNMLMSEHPATLSTLAETLATHGVQKIKENLLTELLQRKLITPKLHIKLKNELDT